MKKKLLEVVGKEVCPDTYVFRVCVTKDMRVHFTGNKSTYHHTLHYADTIIMHTDKYLVTQIRHKEEVWIFNNELCHIFFIYSLPKYTPKFWKDLILPYAAMEEF